MMNFNQEMIEKAKAAKTAEELLEIAKAGGVEMTADEAKTYFAQLNPKSGELDDDELDNVAGGGCGYAKDGRKIVEAKARCHTGFSCKNGCGHNVNYSTYKCNVCGGGWHCKDCAYASREGNKMYCNNPAMGK